jgi:hypothetical protein
MDNVSDILNSGIDKKPKDKGNCVEEAGEVETYCIQKLFV